MANVNITSQGNEITQIKLKNNEQYYLTDTAVRTAVSNIQVSLSSARNATSLSETSLASGDSFETAIGKLHTGLNTTEQVVEAGLNDLDERLSNLEEHDYSKDYFTIVSLEDNNDIKFKCFNPSSENTSLQPQPLTIYVSIDNGTTWTEKTSSTSETIIATLNIGDKLLIKGNNAAYTVMDMETGGGTINLFKSTKTVNIEGNIMSLVYGDNFSSQSQLTSNYTFASLFGDVIFAEPNFTEEETNEIETQYNELIETIGEIEAQKWYYKQIYGKSLLKIISAENLILPNNLTEGCYVYLFYSNVFLKYAPKILPATTLTQGCYNGMFTGCTSLTTAPELPATTLIDNCYNGMFQGCTVLTTAPELPATTLVTNCYYSMFKECTALTTAPELPATALAEGCYSEMFRGCIALTTAPKLPATTLANYCYQSMFQGCTVLTTAPELPATTLANYCYDSMFQDCTNLTTAPKLPVTILANSCYREMFSYCTSLTTAPELPATTLIDYCYHSMFYGCTSLTTAPELYATTLANSCYTEMFYACTKLNYIKCLATDISASSCTYNWISNVASTGTFIKANTPPAWTTGTSGIPSGWTVYTDEEYKEVKHHELATVATSGSYTDLTNKPTIPTKVSDLTNDSGFTTNTGTITGITMNGSSKGTNGVIDLGTVITQETKANWNETNTSSAAYIQNKPTIPTKVSDLTNDSGFTTNTGTITGITMNGSSKGTNGVIDLGTVITQETKANWNETNTSSAAYIQNKPTIPTVPTNVSAFTNDANYTSQTYVNTTVSNLVNKKLTDYSKEYLTFTALQDTTFTFSTNELLYSLDDGTTWTTLTKNTASPTVTAGNKIIWKQTELIPAPSSGIGTFSATGNFDVSGNIMSLHYGDNFIGQKNLTGKNYAFYKLFNGNTKLVNAKNIILPATTLAENCYANMFSGCTSLITTPELPATTLSDYCYQSMFRGCTSLTTAPKLPATTLASYCYESMFGWCSSLTTAPETLPATTLIQGCYSNMFINCTSLTTAPELPATTLASNCYQQMFQGCTSLTTAPELPATTLAERCYYYMFQGCTKLNYIKCLATDISAANCTYNWVNNVAATGIFVKAASMTSWRTGNNGIPYGWTVCADDEYKDVKKYEFDALLEEYLGAEIESTAAILDVHNRKITALETALGDVESILQSI